MYAPGKKAGKLRIVENQNRQKGIAQTKTNKPPKSDERLTYKTKLRYDEYTPLNASQGRILNEIMNVKLQDVSLDVQNILATIENLDMTPMIASS